MEKVFKISYWNVICTPLSTDIIAVVSCSSYSTLYLGIQSFLKFHSMQVCLYEISVIGNRIETESGIVVANA